MNTVIPSNSSFRVNRHCQPGDDECWSTIGISGDRSCAELKSFIHCRNCPVFARVARAFFDREAPDGYLAAWSAWLTQSVEPDHGNDERKLRQNDLQLPKQQVSLLIFRLGLEWLAFRTQTVAEVTTPRPVHSVPHRSNAVLRGLVNLRGQVQLFVSLHGLLGVESPATPTRLVVLRDRQDIWAFAADEVVGVHQVSRGDWRGVPSTLVNPAVGFSQAVLSWQGHGIGVLDEQRVFAALRSLGP